MNQECTEIEFEFQQIPFESQTVSNLTDEHRSQILNYLHATGFKLGLLVNYGHSPKMEYERFVL